MARVIDLVSVRTGSFHDVSLFSKDPDYASLIEAFFMQRIRKAVITGGFGFIGQNLLPMLLDHDFSVLVIDNLSAPVEWATKKFPSVELLRADVTELDSEGLGRFHGACWIHLAAIPFIPDTFERPMETLETNMIGTLRVCRIAAITRARRVLLISSSEVYGGSERSSLLDERSPTLPRSIYGMSKLLSEHVVQECEVEALPWVVLRLFNAYGPCATHPYFIPEMIRQCIKEDEIRVGNLDSWRDFTHVSDGADAILRAMDAPGIERDTINISTGRGWRMGEVLATIQKLCGATSKKVIVDPNGLRPPANDPQWLVGLPDKAKSVLGWCPTVDLGKGLEKTVNQYTDCGIWPYEAVASDALSVLG